MSMYFSSIFSRIRPGTAVTGPFARTNRRLVTATRVHPPAGRFYEYVVIIHDLPSSVRKGRLSPAPPSLERLSFVGNITGSTPEVVCGDVLACQAPSKEHIKQQLMAHPFAKDVWDMKNISIWPFETIHSSPLEPLVFEEKEPGVTAGFA